TGNRERCVPVVICARIEDGPMKGPASAQDDARCATVRTGPLRRYGGGASRLLQGQGGASWRGEHLLDGVGGEATDGVHKAEGAHLHEARQQDMLEEAAHTLQDVEVGGAWTGTAWFAVGEGDAGILQARDAPVGDGPCEDRGRQVLAGGGARGRGLAVAVPWGGPAVWLALFQLSGRV